MNFFVEKMSFFSVENFGKLTIWPLLSSPIAIWVLDSLSSWSFASRNCFQKVLRRSLRVSPWVEISVTTEKNDNFSRFLPTMSREYVFQIYEPYIRFQWLKLDLCANFQVNQRNFKIFDNFRRKKNIKKRKITDWPENSHRGQVWVTENEYHV